MIFCIFDIESSGLEIGSARIVEVGCCLYDEQTREVFEKWSTLVYTAEYEDFSSIEAHNAFAVNGINKLVLVKRGICPKEAFRTVNRYFERADYVIAHAGNNFDKPLLEFEAAQFNVALTEKPWVDSRDDIEYGPGFYSRRLQHLAVDTGANHNVAHRSLEDCLTLSRVIAKFDLKEAVERSKSPLIKIVGEITFHENEKREEAKKRRYLWDREKKQWYKLIRECDFEKENNTTPFVIRKVQYEKTT